MAATRNTSFYGTKTPKILTIKPNLATVSIPNSSACSSSTLTIAWNQSGRRSWISSFHTSGSPSLMMNHSPWRKITWSVGIYHTASSVRNRAYFPQKYVCPNASEWAKHENAVHEPPHTKQCPPKMSFVRISTSVLEMLIALVVSTLGKTYAMFPVTLALKRWSQR